MTTVTQALEPWEAVRNQCVESLFWHDEAGWKARTEALSATLREQALSPTDTQGGEYGELVEREWPDIGVEPLTLPRPRDIAQTWARLRAAMVLQQPHVPSGAALVWRTDLLDVHHRAIRIEVLADCLTARIAELEAKLAEAREATND